MKFGKIEIPQSVLDAQKRGDLVFFLGSGISMSPPSNLPDFLNLVKAISFGHPIHQTLTPTSPLDEILGDLELNGVTVRELAKNELYKADSLHNENHELLVNLSVSNGVPRIVTTNLDTHLESALSKAKVEYDLYKAPAMPLGRDFHGLVYLHGQILQPHKRYVLTAKDFAEAYLTDGWATRFLKDMFENHTVVFVGYSISDPILKYLTLGLPRHKKERFIITSAQGDKWKKMGVEPIYYSLENGKHVQLTEGLKKWSEFYRMDLFDHKNKMKRLLSVLPSNSEEDDEYLLFQLQKQDGYRHFFKEASDPSWLEWIFKNGLHKNLFRETGADDSDFDKHLIGWLCSNFLITGYAQILKAIKENYYILSSSFFGSVCMGLWRSEFPDDSSKRILSGWTKILTSTCPGANRHSLNYVLKTLVENGLKEEAYRLFVFTAQPFLRYESALIENLESPDIYESNSLKVSIGFHVKDYDLDDKTKKFLLGNLHDGYQVLYYGLTEIVNQAYFIEQTNSFFTESYDALSYRRVAIEKHSQNFSTNDIFDTILDIYCEVIVWISKNDEIFFNKIIAWIDHKFQIFRRLAIVAVSETTFLTLQQKMDWLKHHDCCFDIELHHEIFEFFRNNYALANEEGRKFIINALNEYNAKGEEVVRTVQSLLMWLYFNNKECPLIKNALSSDIIADIDANPNDVYGHLDLTRYVSSGGFRSPKIKDASAILSAKATDLENELDRLFKEDPYRDKYSDYLASIEKAAKENQSWLYTTLGDALNSIDSHKDLIDVLIRSVNYEKLNVVQIAQNLAFFDTILQKKISSRSAVDAICKLAEENRKNLSENDIKKCVNICKLFYGTRDDFSSTMDNWLSLAINRKEGRLTIALTHLISGVLTNKYDTKIAEDVLKTLKEEMERPGVESNYVKCILASHLYFYFHNFNDWTKVNILPLFDVQVQKENVKVAFDGYLTWGKWSEELLVVLRDNFVKCAENIGYLTKEANRFFEYVAGFCVYSQVSPLENNWIINILMVTSKEHRESFHRHLKYYLNNVDDVKLKVIWNTWLKAYWNLREAGKPPINSEERSYLLEIAIRNNALFAEIIDFVVEKKITFEANDHLFYLIKENNISNSHPELTAKMLYCFTNKESFIISHSIGPIFEELEKKLNPKLFDDLKKFYITKGFSL